MDIKYIFIRGLRNEIEELPLTKQEEIIKSYLQIFDEKNKEGLSDDEIVKELGSPSDIAFNYLGASHEIKLKEKKVSKNIPLAITMTILDLFVFLEVYLIVILLLFGLLALAVMIILLPYTTFSFINFDINFTFIVSAIFLLGLGLLLIGVCLKLLRNLLKFATSHIGWLKGLYGRGNL